MTDGIWSGISSAFRRAARTLESPETKPVSVDEVVADEVRGFLEATGLELGSYALRILPSPAAQPDAVEGCIVIVRLPGMEWPASHAIEGLEPWLRRHLQPYGISLRGVYWRFQARRG